MSAAVVPDNVDPGTGEMAAPTFRLSWEPLTEDQAREITTKIKATAISLCHLVRDAKTGIAWEPLGYDTWAEYVETEFGMSRQRAQQLIDHANKLDLTAEVVDLASPPAEQIPERATRGLKTDDLRAALVDAMEESPAEMTEAERLIVANKAIDMLRKAKAAASTAVDALTSKIPAPAPDDDAETSDDGAPAPSDELGTPPVPGSTPPGGSEQSHAADAGTGADSGTGLASHPADAGSAAATATSTDGGAASSPDPAPPSLPDDWRQRFDNTTWLIGISVAALRPALSVDPDRLADARDLHAYLTDLLADPETETP